MSEPSGLTSVPILYLFFLLFKKLKIQQDVLVGVQGAKLCYCTVREEILIMSHPAFIFRAQLF